MKVWLASITRDRALELAVAVAIGYALVQLARALTDVPVNALAQHVSREAEDFGVAGFFYSLSFHVGSTVIFYGEVLSSTFALAAVLGLGWLVAIRRDRALGVCPFCASRIPYESTHCAYCGSGVAPGEP